MFKRFMVALLVMVPACLTFGVLVGAVVAYVTPKTYESETIIEIKPFEFGKAPSPGYFATQRELIKSRGILEEVVDRLDLTNRWAMDKQSAIANLTKSLAAQSIKSTDLVRISARHTNATDARDIAREVVEVYSAFMADQVKNIQKLKFEELRAQIDGQQQMIEAQRKALAAIRHPDRTEAEAELERYEEFLEELKLKQTAEEISLRIPREAVELHDEAVIPLVPVAPNVTLCLVLGAVGGLVLAPLLALPLAWLFARASHGSSPPSAG